MATGYSFMIKCDCSDGLDGAKDTSLEFNKNIKPVNRTALTCHHSAESPLRHPTTNSINFELYRGLLQTSEQVVMLDFEDVLPAVVIDRKSGRHGSDLGLHRLLLGHEGGAGSGLGYLYPRKPRFL